MRRTGRVIALLLAVCLLAATPALAKSQRVNAELAYRDITVTVDGVERTLTDTDGNAVEPFIIDGTTYVPVRGLSEALGWDVEWDGDTNSITISTDSEAIHNTVQTDKGAVHGFTVTGAYGGELHCYYGIPYAEAPVGELRWRDAQEKTAWKGELECTAPITEQNSSYQWGNMLLPYFKTLNESEDCLYLHVTTPAETTGDALPVMVWFHGGGMFGGSGSEETYNVTDLPEQGCIVVSVTHRLGAFGMLASDVQGSAAGAADAGNYIISDMIASLKWVKNNIASFGGDPENVTIAGESGGGAKVGILMASPVAAGLFDSAVMQSGSPSSVTLSAAKESGTSLMEALGVTTIEEARAVPAEDIVAAYNRLGLSSSVFVDGYYLTEDPVEAIVNGNYNKCDVLLGANEGELANIGAGMGAAARSILTSAVRDGYKAYAYELDQVPVTWRDAGFHCVHSMDLAYLFGCRDNSERFYEGGPWEQQFFFWGAGEKYDQATGFFAPVMGEDDVKLCEYMMGMWLNFMKTGDPSVEGVTWSPWTAEGENYLYLNTADGAAPLMKTGYCSLFPAA